MSDLMEFVSFIGALFLGICCLVGAYPILRWGFAGILFIWSKRSIIDAAVHQEISETMITER